MNATKSQQVAPLPSFKTGRDANGNKTVKVTPRGSRGFSIQTLGNLPQTHRHGVIPATLGEVRSYVRQFGTAKQKTYFAISS